MLRRGSFRLQRRQLQSVTKKTFHLRTRQMLRVWRKRCLLKRRMNDQSWFGNIGKVEDERVLRVSILVVKITS